MHGFLKYLSTFFVIDVILNNTISRYLTIEHKIVEIHDKLLII